MRAEAFGLLPVTHVDAGSNPATWLLTLVGWGLV